jgi:hypothetical protein
MAVNPLLGYDPGLTNANGIQTKEQWIAATALSMTSEFAYADGSATSPLMAQTVWQQAGIPLPPQNLVGALAKNQNNQLPGSVYSSMYQLASWVYDHPGAVPGISVPSLPSGGPLLGDTDKAAIAAATNAEANRRENAAENAANNQNAIDVANINNAGANARDAADNAAALERTQLQAQVDRESIASNERIATADRASRESIATADRAEQGREFDLNIAEDRRQFNATALTNLLQIGVDLAKNPTDWLGLQFYAENLSIPLTALNLTTMAITTGAIPPTGPSAAGPVTGGPAAMAGDTTLAQMAGVQAAFGPQQQAVQQNPGTGSPATGNQAFAATANLQRAAAQAGGVQELERAVAQGRATSVPQAVGQNPVTQQGQQLAQQIMAHAPMLDSQAGNLRLSDLNGFVNDLFHTARQPQSDASQQPSPFGAPPSEGQWVQGPDGRWTLMYHGNPAAVTTGPHDVAPQGGVLPSGDSPGNPGYTTLPLQPTTQLPNTQPNPLLTATQAALQSGSPTASNTGTGQNTGVYTGQQSPATTANASPYGNAAILDAIAQQLGVPASQVAQLVPANLLPQAATQAQLAASPVIQSLQSGGDNGFSQYRTAPVGDSKFGTLQAFGIPVGLRGGQDYNAETFLNANPETQAQVTGAINATGQYFPTFQKQMLQSSPLSNYNTGAFGKRVF